MLKINTELRLGDSFTHRANFTAGDELVVIFGPSGAGKSITLNVLAGLATPDKGFVRAGDQVFFDSAAKINMPPQRRQVGYVFQDYALFPHLSVERNISFGLSGLSKAQIADRVDEMLDLMRLTRHRDRHPAQISGGQKQRVALARALVLEPSMLLLDEPFSALDSAVREKFRLDLLKIRDRYNIPIIFVTHDLEEAYMLADRVVVFNNGRVLQSGSRDEVFHRPANRTVARFVGTKNIFSGDVKSVVNGDCTIDTDRFQIVAPSAPGIKDGDRVEFCIRPEDVMIVRGDRDLKNAISENVFSGEVVGASPRGATCLVEFRVDQGRGPAEDFDFTIRLPAHAYQRLELGVGRKAKISLKKPAIHICEKESV